MGRRTARLVGAYECVAGALAMLRSITLNLQAGGSAIGFNVIVVLAGLVSMVLGGLLWSSPVQARRASAVFQGLQIPRLVFGKLQFGFLVGAELTAKLMEGRLVLHTAWGVTATAY